MDKLNLVEKLRDKANVSYEEAKAALENSNWDMLDAVLYLEEAGRVKRPTTSEFYTNEYKESYKNKGEVIEVNLDKSKYKSKNEFEGIFEAICKTIDTCNNIFVEIRRSGKILFKIPLTVLIVLFFFAFWILIPLVIVGLFFDIEFIVSTNKVNRDNVIKVNNVFSEISKFIKELKDKIKKGLKNV